MSWRKCSQLLRPHAAATEAECLEPVLHKRSHKEGGPEHCSQRKTVCSNKDSAQPKIINKENKMFPEDTVKWERQALDRLPAVYKVRINNMNCLYIYMLLISMLDEQERDDTDGLFRGLESNGVARESDEREPFHWEISSVFFTILSFFFFLKGGKIKNHTWEDKKSPLGCWLLASSEGVPCLESLLSGLLLSLWPLREPSKASWNLPGSHHSSALNLAGCTWQPLGWPEGSLGFSLDSLWKNLDKHFGQPSITNFLPCLTTLCVTESQISFSPHLLCSRAPPLFPLWLCLLSILSAKDALSWFSQKPPSCHPGLSCHKTLPSHQS